MQSSISDHLINCELSHFQVSALVYLVIESHDIISAMSSPSSRPRISGPLGEGRKRKRTPLSCFDCRRRKLKCDREYPSCSRCRKAGLASSCSYDERPRSPKQSTATPVAPLAPSDWSSTSPTTHPVARVRQGNRIEIGPSTLETSQTSGTWQLTAFSGERPYVKAALGPAPHEAIIFRGNNFKTQYYGGSNPTSIIAHVGSLGLVPSHNTNKWL
jgi:hypothetical protein